MIQLEVVQFSIKQCWNVWRRKQRKKECFHWLRKKLLWIQCILALSFNYFDPSGEQYLNRQWRTRRIRDHKLTLRKKSAHVTEVDTGNVLTPLWRWIIMNSFGALALQFSWLPPSGWQQLTSCLICSGPAGSAQLPATHSILSVRAVVAAPPKHLSPSDSVLWKSTATSSVFLLPIQPIYFESK